MKYADLDKYFYHPTSPHVIKVGGSMYNFLLEIKWNILFTILPPFGVERDWG